VTLVTGCSGDFGDFGDFRYGPTITEERAYNRFSVCPGTRVIAGNLVTNTRFSPVVWLKSATSSDASRDILATIGSWLWLPDNDDVSTAPEHQGGAPRSRFHHDEACIWTTPKDSSKTYRTSPITAREEMEENEVVTAEILVCVNAAFSLRSRLTPPQAAALEAAERPNKLFRWLCEARDQLHPGRKL